MMLTQAEENSINVGIHDLAAFRYMKWVWQDVTSVGTSLQSYDAAVSPV